MVGKKRENSLIDVQDTAYAFEFTGERLCLDFVNTLSERGSSVPEEHLNSYADLLAWSRQAGIVDEQRGEQLQALSEGQPGRAGQEIEQARWARELLFRIFSALTGGQSPRQEDLEQFNALLAATMKHARIAPGDSGFVWDWSEGQDRLELPLWIVVRDAADLLTSRELSRVRTCASDDCDWLFLDTSKNRSRRWCDMKSCGNRAKARRHYGRKKGSAAE
jgi:predicted RNA-binding Zn ribbon-like protein